MGIHLPSTTQWTRGSTHPLERGLQGALARGQPGGMSPPSPPSYRAHWELLPGPQGSLTRVLQLQNSPSQCCQGCQAGAEGTQEAGWGSPRSLPPACRSKHKKHFEGLVEKDGVGEKRGWRLQGHQPCLRPSYPQKVHLVPFPLEHTLNTALRTTTAPKTTTSC